MFLIKCSRDCLNRGNVSFGKFLDIAFNLIFHTIYFSLVIPVHKLCPTALPVIVFITWYWTLESRGCVNTRATNTLSLHWVLLCVRRVLRLYLYIWGFRPLKVLSYLRAGLPRVSCICVSEGNNVYIIELKVLRYLRAGLPRVSRIYVSEGNNGYNI